MRRVEIPLTHEEYKFLLALRAEEMEAGKEVGPVAKWIRAWLSARLADAMAKHKAPKRTKSKSADKDVITASSPADQNIPPSGHDS